MSSLGWSIVILVLVAAAAVFIYVMIELRAAIRALKELLQTTEGSLKTTLDELQMSLRSTRTITDNVGIMTEDVKILTGAVRDAGIQVKQVTGLVDSVTSATAIKVSGVRAGVRAALDVLIQHLFTRRRQT